MLPELAISKLIATWNYKETSGISQPEDPKLRYCKNSTIKENDCFAAIQRKVKVGIEVEPKLWNFYPE
jgi:UV DNA damage repair endonuclease